MNTTTTNPATAPAVEIPGEVFGVVCDAVRLLDTHCDDPRGFRAHLDERASALYHAADDAPGVDLPLEMRNLARDLWRVMDELDRLREDADDLYKSMLATLP
jgi:hypothetical protein